MPGPSIATLEKTSPACPAQWEGRLESGEAFYVRFRYGLLTVGFGPDLDAAIEASDGFEVELSEDGLDGWLEWEEAETHFARAWADYETTKNRKPS
jgi:hypothetical protein